jgi:hypothetical protein
MAKKKLFDQAVEEIERGQKGLNEGLPMGFDRLVEYIPNFQRSTYYLVGGNTGAGKSAFTDEAFIFNPFEHCLEHGNLDDFEVLYYSFEINKINKILKAIARRVFMKFHILIDMNYILSRGKNRVSAEVYDYVMELRGYFEALEDRMTIIDMAQDPDSMKVFVQKHAEKNGELVISPIGEIDYYPNNPAKVTAVVLDHAGLTKNAKGKSIKDTIDEVSQNFVPIRNVYGYSPVLIQQLTAGSASADRMKGNTKKAPVLDDFGGSKFTPFDANIVLALFNPARLEMPEYKGYNIGVFKDRFRSLELLKNRDGSPDVSLGMKFIGEVGMFRELPKANDIDLIEKEYTKLDNLKNLKPKTNG